MELKEFTPYFIRVNNIYRGIDKCSLICYNIPMNNKTIKILIVLGIFVAFSFGVKNTFADYTVKTSNGLNYKVVNTVPKSNYYEEDEYNGDIYSVKTSTSKYTDSVTGDTVVNNYYNTQPTKVATTTAPASTTKTNTTNINTTKSSTSSNTKTTANTDNKNVDEKKVSGATDVTGSNLTALSLNGSGSFMPSSVWQWILVIFLILVIIILARIVSKPRPQVVKVHA